MPSAGPTFAYRLQKHSKRIHYQKSTPRVLLRFAQGASSGKKLRYELEWYFDASSSVVPGGTHSLALGWLCLELSSFIPFLLDDIVCLWILFFRFFAFWGILSMILVVYMFVSLPWSTPLSSNPNIPVCIRNSSLRMMSSWVRVLDSIEYPQH